MKGDTNLFSSNKIIIKIPCSVDNFFTIKNVSYIEMYAKSVK